MGYTAMTVGNHEFDDGPEVLRGFVDTVNFPVLMSNADVTREDLLKDVIQKSVVIQQEGQRIGLIGLTPIDTDELASPGPNVIFLDPTAAVQGEVDKLMAIGVNKIIVLSHSSYQVDQAIAANTTGVDVIVGGHSNTLLSNTNERAQGPYPTMVNNTAIVQAYAYGKFLGELNVTFDDEGNIMQAVGEPLVMDKTVIEDTATKSRIAEAAIPLGEIRSKVVASSSAIIQGERDVCRVQECEMGNLVADAMLDSVVDEGVTISIANSGGLRASIDAGDVTMGEVLTVLPFSNTLATFEISGQVVIDALENGVSQVEEVKGRFPQVAGIRFTWDPSVAPNEGRIVEVLVAEGNGFVPIDPAATYMAVSNNYVRNGGDGYKMFRSAQNAYDYGPGLEVVLADYMAAQGSYVPYLDGRIGKK
jgi:5'-nucleotidase